MEDKCVSGNKALKGIHPRNIMQVEGLDRVIWDNHNTNTMVTTQTFHITVIYKQSMPKADERIFFWKKTTQKQRNSCNNIMMLKEHNKNIDSIK